MGLPEPRSFRVGLKCRDSVRPNPIGDTECEVFGRLDGAARIGSSPQWRRRLPDSLRTPATGLRYFAVRDLDGRVPSGEILIDLFPTVQAFVGWLRPRPPSSRRSRRHHLLTFLFSQRRTIQDAIGESKAVHAIRRLQDLGPASDEALQIFRPVRVHKGHLQSRQRSLCRGSPSLRAKRHHRNSTPTHHKAPLADTGNSLLVRK